jgi:mono/diheme cytochrome c family protein
LPTAPARAGADLRLNGEPRSFSAFAAGKDPQAQRASAVLNRIVWPGKPGAVAITPLTAAEQVRFAQGRDVYKSICQGCHQPDGRGQERIAPSLVGSTLALAPADIPARVLLHGKEGAIGLMPPVGATLQDEQIAAVLTYIRREWGQSGSPVEAATVKQVRDANAARTRPWRHDELIKMIPAAPARQ